MLNDYCFSCFIVYSYFHFSLLTSKLKNSVFSKTKYKLPPKRIRLHCNLGAHAMIFVRKNLCKNDVKKSLRRFGMLCFLRTNKFINIHTNIALFSENPVNFSKIFVDPSQKFAKIFRSSIYCEKSWNLWRWLRLCVFEAK